jgi:Ca-activated chloride channel family protein
MRFGSPEALWLVILVPALSAFFVWAFWRKSALLRRFAEIEMLKRMVAGTSGPRQLLKMGLLTLAVLFLALSLARPQWGTKMELMKRKGLDVVVAVDVSHSMFAEDIKPNRLARSKQEIQRFVERLAGDRVALVAFAGAAYLQCPLTSDYGAFRIFLDVLDPDLIEVPGTDIGQAIEASMGAFDPKDRKYRVLVLLTDGEDHSGRAEKAAEEAAQRGIAIFTVGIGSPSGVPIPVKDRSGRVAYKKDAQGGIVTTKMDPGLLQKIALITDGKFYHAQPGHFELQEVLEEINAMEKRELESERFTRFEERFQIPLALALFLLVAEMLLSDRRRRGKEWAGRFT